MKKLLLPLLAALLLLPSATAKPAAAPIRFLHLGVNEGLSQNTVSSITQDRQGFLWIATHDGLNRYDGYDFTVYQHNDKDSTSIGSDLVRTCITDSQGRLWVGTDCSLSYYDPMQNHFRNYPLAREGEALPVMYIAELDSTHLLVTSNKDERLYTFDIKAGQFSPAQLHPGLQSVCPKSISRQGDMVFIGSKQGVYAYSPADKSLKEVAPEHLRGKEVLCFLHPSATQLWVGTEGDGIFRIDLLTGETRHYSTQSGNGIRSNYVRSLCLDAQNRIWIGSLNSLSIYDPATDTFSHYGSDLRTSGTLSQASVRHIYMDQQGGMWMGTYYGGLNYYHPLKNRFRSLTFTPNRNSLNSNFIGCIREDHNGELWIGTNSGGVNRYNPATGQFTHYTTRQGLASNDVKHLYIDEERDLVYIGTHAGGLSTLHRRTGHIETTIGREFRNIYSIEPTLDGKFWVGGMTTLLQFDPQTKQYTSVNNQADGSPLMPDRITTLLRDRKQRLWLGGEKGFAVYTETDGKLSPVTLIPATHSLYRQYINSFYEDRTGNFWIATHNGIYHIDEQTGKTSHFTTRQGLANNVAHGILEDNSGTLWISTNKGISSFLPATGKFRSYSGNEGLLVTQYTDNAFCRTASGEMLFGGIGGITGFHPNRLTDNPYTPPVVITSLKVFNKPVLPGDETGILSHSISHTREITLTAAQSSTFSLDFAVPNFLSGQANTFAYRLEGNDKHWFETTQLRTVSYSNLPAGTYHFKVKAANSDGKWNDNPTTLTIRVLPVWYKTWWAILLFISTIAVAVTFTIRHFWQRKMMKAQLLLERSERESQREVNEMKLRFFINISHELRTPLTLILAPVEELVSYVKDPWIRRQLEHIRRNTNRLLHLVNQLMDYRRAELGVFELKVKPCAIHEVVKSSFSFYESVARRKGIAYTLKSELKGREVVCDPNYVELIENNLLSNAFKYTDEGQSITVTLKEEAGRLILQVKDTGRGIPIQKQAKIFERFYQADNEHIGSGIGLSLVQRLVELHHGEIKLDSCEGEGSTFTISLPARSEDYRPEETAATATDIGETPVHTTNHMYVADLDDDAEDEDTATGGEEQQERILVVEDNVEIRQYLCDELGHTYHVLKAGNGREALDLIKEQEVNLILTDVMMPVMDGLQLCKHIKQNISTCHIPIIILSAKADINEQLEGLQVGADDYISKPFSMPILSAKIKNLFRTRRSAIELYSKSMDVEPEKLALTPLDEDLLRRAKEVVEKHMDDVEFSTEVFAREMFMSRSNLHAKLKSITGETTNDFIRRIRFNYAGKLLKEKRYSIAEISTMVGYSTSSYFSTCFKKYYGCMPTEYGK